MSRGAKRACLSNDSEKDVSLTPDDDSDLVEIGSIPSYKKQSKKYSIENLLHDHLTKPSSKIWDRINQIKQQELLSSPISSQKQSELKEAYEDLTRFELCPIPFFTESKQFQTISDFLAQNPFASTKIASSLLINKDFILSWISYVFHEAENIEVAIYYFDELVEHCYEFNVQVDDSSLLFDLFYTFLSFNSAGSNIFGVFARVLKKISFPSRYYEEFLRFIMKSNVYSLGTCLELVKQINSKFCKQICKKLLDEMCIESKLIATLNDLKGKREFLKLLSVATLAYYAVERSAKCIENIKLVKQLKEFESGLSVFDKESLTLSKDLIFQLTCECMNVVAAFNPKKNPLLI